MRTFYGCKNLRRVVLPEGLYEIGIGAFSESGVKRVDLPSSTREIGAEAFAKCVNLLIVQLNEGLKVLGTDEFTLGDKQYLGVFQGSGLRDIVFPSTLKRVEYRTFAGCGNLKAIEFPDGLEYLGEHCF